MDTKEMIEVMQAFEDGKKIETKYRKYPDDPWGTVQLPTWNWNAYEYRIAPEPEPKKEGRWERVEIVKQGNAYFRTEDDSYRLDVLPSIPGFGGIDYQSPFDLKVIVRSMVPLMFKSRGDRSYVTVGDYCEEEVMLFEQTDRPGIPVAAWFWRE